MKEPVAAERPGTPFGEGFLNSARGELLEIDGGIQYLHNGSNVHAVMEFLGKDLRESDAQIGLHSSSGEVKPGAFVYRMSVGSLLLSDTELRAPQEWEFSPAEYAKAYPFERLGGPYRRLRTTWQDSKGRIHVDSGQWQACS